MQQRPVLKTSPMSEYLAIFSDQLKNVQPLMPINEIYVDDHKTYVIVPTSTYNELKTQANLIGIKVNQLQEQLKREQDKNIMFIKTLEIKCNDIAQLTINNTNLTHNITKIHNNSQNQRNRFNLQPQNQPIKIRPFERIQTPKRLCVDSWVQTAFDEEVIWVGSLAPSNLQKITVQSSAVARMSFMDVSNKQLNPNQRHRKQIEQLKKTFKHEVESISTQIRTKMQQITREQQQMKHFRKLNTKLTQQNNDLKFKLIQINEKQYKMRIWKQLLEQEIQKINQQSQQSVLNIIVNENNAGLGNQNNIITQMQTTIDRLEMEERQRQNKNQQVKIMLDEVDVGVVGQENIVGTLVGLSAKIKGIVKYLLEEL